MEEIFTKAIDSLDVFSGFKDRTATPYLLSAIILAALVYLFSSKRQMIDENKPKSFKNMLAYIFPKDVYLHKSSRQDYVYFLLNAFVYYGFLIGFVLSIPFFVLLSKLIMTGIFGTSEITAVPASTLQIIILTLVFTLAYDFGAFFMHYVMHRIPALWAFHKVHHSAERLNPMTLYRMHPVDLVLTKGVIAVCAGSAVGIATFIMNIDIQFIEILGINAIFFLYYIFGYNLRHSHIWVNYPKWLSHILISPAQHQIHHSAKREHWDKNMGLIFSFWDHLFKTLYIPARDEPKFSYGINEKAPNPYDDVSSMFLLPFKESWIEIKKKYATSSYSIIKFTAILFLLGFSYNILWRSEQQVTSLQNIPNTVMIEDLTWSETALAIDKGYTNVIIPTGGTEQNGLHMILGKHNYVVSYTAQEIAKRLGSTLVAPVISYVPEEVHMGFAGTISVREETFAAILEDSARSLKRHGFTNIYFIGDSFGNQDMQQAIADKLSLEWQADGAVAAHISDYYQSNGQIAWLEDKGYSMREIGGHAGIRDTSELIKANIKGVRKHPYAPKSLKETGANGEHSIANKKLGEEMLELKIKAALKQINAITP